jgi:hypothetical protein
VTLAEGRLNIALDALFVANTNGTGLKQRAGVA